MQVSLTSWALGWLNNTGIQPKVSWYLVYDLFLITKLIIKLSMITMKTFLLNNCCPSEFSSEFDSVSSNIAWKKKKK